MAIQLPNGWEFFYEDVCKKIKLLTACGIWTTDASTIFAWLGNLKKDEHKYIAAHILDRITFRTEKMIEGGYKLFLASNFRELASRFTCAEHDSIEEWFEILRSHPKGSHANIHLCSVSKIGDNGDSGSHMVRILTGELFNQNRTISPDRTPLYTLKNRFILIVDDFVGSGAQFKDFAEETGLREAAKNNYIVYAPALAYYRGLESIHQEDYGLHIMPLETLNKHEQFFQHDKGCMFCGDDLNVEPDVLETYKEMRLLDSNFGKGSWLGRDNASLSVVFQWGCPNQSLGIMWYEGGSEWNRLARRRGAQ